MALTSDLQKIVGAEHVRCDGETSRYPTDGRVPRAVVFPGSAEETGAVLAICNEFKAAVVPWGGGTSMGLGALPSAVDVAIDLRRLDRVIDHEPEDMTSTVQPGITLQRYREHLGRHGQFLALDPPQSSHATIGGILAANASGPRRLRYGTARDLLIGLRVAHADGTITKGGAKVVKNVTGYDMNKLYVGSLGTLGVIVEATFRLYPRPAAERTWLGRFTALADAGRAIARILDSPVVPSALELLNDAAAIGIGQGFADMPREGCIVGLAVASVPEAVDAQLRRAQSLAGQDGLLLDGAEHDAFWAAVRDYSGDAAVILKAALPIGAVAGYVSAAEQSAHAHRQSLAAIAEAGSGIVRCYVRAETPSGAASLVTELRSAAEAMRGSLVVLQAPADLKAAVDVWGPVKGLDLMRRLKAEFDPARILNPGRFVGGI